MLIFTIFILSACGIVALVRLVPNFFRNSAKSMFNPSAKSNDGEQSEKLTLLSAALLAFPGFFTAFAAVCLFLPPIRGYASSWISKRIVLNKTNKSKIFSQFLYTDVVDVDINKNSQKTSSTNSELDYK